MAHQITDDYGLFMVADGLGGHHGGEKASQFFCQAVFSLLPTFQPKLQDKPEAAISNWFEQAVIEMRKLFANDPYAEQAHTTCALLYLDNRQTITAHCGDSRIYRLNQEQILWRTRDHSLPQQLLDNGEISEGEMGLHPDQNQLTRSINIITQHAVDVQVFPPAESTESFVLCTDGFWEYIKEAELLSLADPGTDKMLLRKMAKLMMVRAAGKSDNITVQLVRLADSSWS
jgi:PPM family protein phosphatase